MQPNEIVHVNKALKKSFKHVNFYFVAVPTYVGGIMALGFATDIAPSLNSQEVSAVHKDRKYYTPSIHKAAFAMPNFIMDLLQ
jgi:spermidine synthase